MKLNRKEVILLGPELLEVKSAETDPTPRQDRQETSAPPIPEEYRLTEPEKGGPLRTDPDFKTATLSRWPPWIGKRCVKVKRTAHDVQVQDSKLGDSSPTLSFTHAEWEAFIAGVKQGEFDLHDQNAELEVATTR